MVRVATVLQEVRAWLVSLVSQDHKVRGAALVRQETLDVRVLKDRMEGKESVDLLDHVELLVRYSLLVILVIVAMMMMMMITTITFMLMASLILELRFSLAINTFKCQPRTRLLC